MPDLNGPLRARSVLNNEIGSSEVRLSFVTCMRTCRCKLDDRAAARNDSVECLERAYKWLDIHIVRLTAGTSVD